VTHKYSRHHTNSNGDDASKSDANGNNTAYTDVLTFIIQFIYCRNKSLDWSQLVFKDQPNQIGPVLFGLVVVLQVGATV